MCQNLGIATSILSVIPFGGVVFKGAEGARLARQCNEYGKSIRDAQPQQYGFFATLPNLINTELALQEIRYALDECKADGVALWPFYGEGNHDLGHRDLQLIWEELNRRHAVVFVHPIREYDTTRAAIDLIMTDTIRKYPNCKIILPCGGGCLPYLAARPAVILADLKLSSLTRGEFLECARTFYFDTALTDGQFALSLLRQFAKPDRILFGSDFPLPPTASIKYFADSQNIAELNQDEKENFAWKNAMKLFPRLRSLCENEEE